MRRIILLALIALTATAGTAAADRHRRDHRGDRHQRWDRGGHDRRVIVRDNRRYDRPHRRVVRDNYRYRNVDRRPIYVNNNRYVFSNGRTFHYRRPVINYRYTNYRVRPQLLVENYDTVPGYIWVSGRWNWTGYEWDWVPGHYQIDPSYQYNDAYYYQSPVADHDCH